MLLPTSRLFVEMNQGNNKTVSNSSMDIDWVLKATSTLTAPKSATTAPPSLAPRQCRLIVGPVAILAQLVLLLVVILALIIKR